MEEYAQFVDVEPVTVWERVRCFLIILRGQWLYLSTIVFFSLIVRSQLGEMAAVLTFLVGSVIIAIGAFPRTREIYAHRAMECQLTGDLENAVANYRQALAEALARDQRGTTDTQYIHRRVDPFYANVLYTLGMLYGHLNQLIEAEVAFKRALELGVDTPLLLAELGAVFLRQGRIQDAQEAFDKALASVETAPTRNLYSVSQRFQFALRRSYIPALDPEQYGIATIYASIGDAYTQVEQYQKALAIYERAIAVNPQSFEAQSGLGRIYLEFGDYDKAITAYRHALANRLWSPTYQAPVYHNLGIALLKRERLSEAQAAFEQAIALNRRSPSGYLGLARFYIEQGQYERALEHCQRALALAPASSYLHTILGRIYADQGRYEETIAELQRAMDLSPHLGGIWLERARMEAMRGDTEAALAYLAQALERGPRLAIRRRALEEKKLRPLHEHPRFRELLDIDDEENPTAP